MKIGMILAKQLMEFLVILHRYLRKLQWYCWCRNWNDIDQVTNEISNDIGQVANEISNNITHVAHEIPNDIV